MSNVDAASFKNVDWKTVTIKQVSALIKAGANIHVRDHQGKTPLMVAKDYNNTAAFSALAKAEADEALRNKKENAPKVAK